MIKWNTREEWLTAAAAELVKLYTRHNTDTMEYFVRATRWSCSAPKTRRARIMSTMYEPGERSTGERAVKFEIFVRAEVSNEISVLREVAINIHRIACTSNGSRYTSRDSLAAAYDVFVMPGARRAWSDWGFDIDRASSWWASTGQELLGDYPHDEVDAEAIAKRRQSTRQLKLLCSGCGFIARATWSALQRAEGTPTCACGTRIQLVNKDGTPILIDGRAAASLLEDVRVARTMARAAAASSAADASATTTAVEAASIRASNVRLAELTQTDASSPVVQSTEAQARAANRMRNWSRRGKQFTTPPEWNDRTMVTVRVETLRRMGCDAEAQGLTHFGGRSRSMALKDLVQGGWIPASVKYLGIYAGQPVFRFGADIHKPVGVKKDTRSPITMRSNRAVYIYGLVQLTMDTPETYMERRHGSVDADDVSPNRAPYALRDIALSASSSGPPSRPLVSTTYRWPDFITGAPVEGEQEQPTQTSKRWAAILEEAAETQDLIDDGQTPAPRKFKISKRFAKLYDTSNAIPSVVDPHEVWPLGRQRRRRRFEKLDLPDAPGPSKGE